MEKGKIEEEAIEPAPATSPNNEADSIYGNKATVEEYGYVERGSVKTFEP